MTTSRPSLLLWTSTRRVARLLPTSRPRMVTCKWLSAAASRLYVVVPVVLFISWLEQTNTPGRYNT